MELGSLVRSRSRRRGPLADLEKVERRLLRVPLKYLWSSESKNAKYSRELRAEWQLYDQLSALLVQLLIHIQQKDSRGDRFEEAVLLLGYKILSHFRSIKASLYAGWHGTAHSLLSLLVSDLNMLMYLGFRRDLVDAWFMEGQDAYQNDPTFREKFSESTISKTLEDRGIKETHYVFRLFRKTTHGSYWGTQAYTVDMRLFIPPSPPDFRIVLATIGFASLFVSSFIHWLLNDEPAFGTPFKGKEYDSFRQIHDKLGKATGHWMANIAGFLERTKGSRP